MFLKKLTIENGESIIREISFKKGINLIVDEGTTDNKESGNNVGKTTVLRLIDFCLGGKGDNIYKDSEFKKKGSNATVENFLKNNNIIVTLVLKENLEDEKSSEIIIKRNFLSRNGKIQEINGKSYKNGDFTMQLSKLIFKSELDKPTFRQIISKNIRDEKNRLQNTLKVLHQTTKQEEYEALFFFWLGITVDSFAKKQELLTNLRIENVLHKQLSENSSLSQIEQSLIVINDNIEDFEKEKNRFAVDETYEDDLKNLNAVKSKLNRQSTRISQIELRKELILESKKELEREVSNVNVDLIKSLYKEANSLIPDLQKSFEDTLAFHNQMIFEKSKFIESELPQIESNLKKNNDSLNELLSLEKKLSIKLYKAGAIETLQIVVRKLNQAYEQKGQYEELQKLLKNSLAKIKDYEDELAKINKGIDSHAYLLNKKIEKFNKHFTHISSKLYDEQFILSHTKNSKSYELNIATIEGNLGTGKKKGEMLAFDLAYILFADELDIKCLHFILHDQIETVHDNQINNLLTDIIKKVNCQLILPVLRDKLPSEIDVSNFEVLSLSQNSKFFKV